MKLCIVGGGVAGTAAAWRAARSGANVELVHGRAGASSLYSGALDFEGRVEAEVAAFAAALGAWELSAQAACIATGAGRIRTAHGRDTALLDLEPLAGKKIAVADVERDDWDAPLLAQALGASAHAVDKHMQFEAVRVPVLEHGFERRIGAYDFAALFDASSRLAKLARAVEKSAGGYDAMLLGPWLGVVPETAERLRELVTLRIGETTSPPGGPAGARFEQARDRLLEELSVPVVRARVDTVARSARGFSVELEGGRNLDADAVLLATGGIAGGGIVLVEPGPRGGGRAFVLSLHAPAALELDGRELDAPSTMFGLDMQVRGLAALERVGIRADGPNVRGESGLFCAGDVVAARPRTALEAARAGIAAARAAAG